MHVAASPLLVELPLGETARVTVAITNTSTLIDAYVVRVFGLDPQWVAVSTPRLSLFPSEVGQVEVIVSLPADYPAGLRQLAIHVVSENDATEFSLAQITLDVGGRPRTSLRVDPVSVVGGNRAQFALVIANDGNATIQERPLGIDPEDVVEIGFEPTTVVLPPGRREVVRAEVRGGRPWFGQPKPRVLSFSLGPAEPPAMATFIQKPRVGRWLISLLGLITVAAVFAAVLSRTLDKVVDESSVDDELLNEALDDEGQDGAQVSVTPSTITGQVALASGQGVGGVQVELFSSGNGTVPLATGATDPSGTFAFGRLAPGKYRLRFSGAGFTEQWYQGAVTFADATDVTIHEDGSVDPLESLELGGRPGTVSGDVLNEDPVGAVAKLVVPGPTDPDTDALVDEVPVSADGSFRFEDVPSPATYQLIVDKPGFGSETRDVVLRPAEDHEGIEIMLREGDGEVSGRIDSPSGPLGGVRVVATDGTTEVSTVSLTLDDVGFYAVRGLPTPGQYTLTFQRDGYTSETRTVDLVTDQQLPGLGVSLAPSTGSLSGTVSENDVGPIGGVTVTITGADLELTTMSASTGTVGLYVFEELPVPATYTITFTKTGLVSQSRLENLDPLAGTANPTGIDATLLPADAVIAGTVFDVGSAPVAGAAVSMTDGTNTFAVRSADDPLGRFEFADLAPGTYTVTASMTGTSPAIVLVNVIAAEVADVNIGLAEQASLDGFVEHLNEEGTFVAFPDARVRLFLAEDFPGAPSDAVAETLTDAVGFYEFPGLDAPEDYVVAVYRAATSDDALDAVLVQTVPSDVVHVDTFRLREDS